MIAIFDVKGAAVAADCEFIEADNICDSAIKFGPINYDYKWGLVDSEDERIAWASKDKKNWTLAFVFVIDGSEDDPVRGSEIAQAFAKAENGRK